MDKKTLLKPSIQSPLDSVVFIDEETSGLIIHIQGFDNNIQAKEFANYMMIKSGMRYIQENDLFASSSFSIN